MDKKRLGALLKVRFTCMGLPVWFKLERYVDNGRLCIAVWCRDPEEGYDEPFATLTVNYPQFSLAEDEIIIKNWSENEQLVIDAYATGIFEDTGKKVITGHVIAPVWRIKV